VKEAFGKEAEYIRDNERKNRKVFAAK